MLVMLPVQKFSTSQVRPRQLEAGRGACAGASQHAGGGVKVFAAYILDWAALKLSSNAVHTHTQNLQVASYRS